MKRRWLFVMLLTGVGADFARADSPGMIHYQGRLALGTNLYSGPVSLVFRMYDAPTAGALLHTSTNFAMAVDGLYATVIGQHGVVGDLDAALTNAQVWLEVQVNGSTLSPRERLLAVPYARAVYGLRVVHTNNIVLNAEAGLNSVGNNSIFSSIGGGYQNIVDPEVWYATIGGGRNNQIQPNSWYATIGGGYLNEIQPNSSYATIGGGWENQIQTNSDYTTIGGGYENQIQPSTDYATIGGGGGNKIQPNSLYATIGGGYLNSIGPTSIYAIIPGGYSNRVGTNATAACAVGAFAHALHAGAFVWSDNSAGTATVSTNANSVTFRAAGGYRLFSNSATNLGARLDPNATAWAAISDREAKEAIEPIDARQVLEGVKTLPLSSWEYKADPGDRRYIGPMAQDFQSAFGLGDDKTINTLDADGVLFAAVQALANENERIAQENARISRENEQMRMENKEIRTETRALREELEALKRRFSF